MGKIGKKYDEGNAEGIQGYGHAAFCAGPVIKIGGIMKREGP